MLFPEGIPVAGGAVLAGLLYAGFSMFVTGPMIGERMAERLEWGAQCPRYLKAEAEAAEPELSAAPTLNCESTIGLFFGREGQAFCAVHGDTINNNPISRSIEAGETAKRELQHKRLSLAAERAGSRCECAVTATLEERRVPFAIFAGSARLIVPAPVRRLESDLVTALNTPACAMKE